MVLAFISILVIVLQKANIATTLTGAATVGYILIFISSWFQAGMSVLNRKMANLHWSIIMFVYSYVGFTFSLIYMFIEAFIKGGFIIHEPIIYLKIAGICVIDYFKVTAQVIAFQNDSPTFVSLVQ